MDQENQNVLDLREETNQNGYLAKKEGGLKRRASDLGSLGLKLYSGRNAAREARDKINEVREIFSSTGQAHAKKRIQGFVASEIGHSEEVQKIFHLRNKFTQKADEIQALMSDKNFKRRNQLEGGSIFLMIGTAIFFDTLQAGLILIPFVGWILSSFVSIFAWLTFYTWTSIKGWGLSDTAKGALIKWAKRSKWFIPVMEFFPIINAIPLWTFGALLQVAILKADDAAYNASFGKIDMKKLAEIAKKHRNLARDVT